jgi:type IV secretion system protein VirB10
MADLDDQTDDMPRPARPRGATVLLVGGILAVILAGGGYLLHTGFDSDEPDLPTQKNLATIGADPPPAISDPGDRATYFAPPPEPMPAPPMAPVPEPAAPAPFVPPASWSAPIALIPSPDSAGRGAGSPGYARPATPASRSAQTSGSAGYPQHRAFSLPQETAVQGASAFTPAAYTPMAYSPDSAAAPGSYGSAGPGSDISLLARPTRGTALQSLASDQSQRAGQGEEPSLAGRESPFAEGDSAPLYGTKAGIVQASQNAGRNVSRLRTPSSSRTLSPGTIVHAVLTTGINSDLPGSFNARVTRTVWDEVTGEVPLIPQGSLITGSVASQVEYGEERAFLVAKYIRLAGTNAHLDIGGMSGSALDGTAGVPAEVNNHYDRTIGVGILTAILGAGSAVARAGIDDDRNSIQSESIASGTTELQSVGGQFLQRELRLRPTLTAKPGDQFSFILNRELQFGDRP